MEQPRAERSLWWFQVQERLKERHLETMLISRDVEGRSALLLGKAKDNNASCAVGPFIRLFDETFSIDDVRKVKISMTIEGEVDFRL